VLHNSHAWWRLPACLVCNSKTQREAVSFLVRPRAT
jgi:hypothetical protein